jgi:hypothetical protein
MPSAGRSAGSANCTFLCRSFFVVVVIVSPLIVFPRRWLDYNQFQGSIPKCIGNFLFLEVLNLESNQLSGEIPEGIIDLHPLKVLYVSPHRPAVLPPETHFHSLPPAT